MFKERKKWNYKLKEGILERRVTRGQAEKWKCLLCFEGGGDVQRLYHGSEKGRGERRMYAVNCSVRIKIYLKGK